MEHKNKQHGRGAAKRSYLVVVLLATVGCDLEGAGVRRPPAPPPTPVITGLSVTEASVGDPITFLGHDFVSAEQGWTDVHFVGEFVPNDGGSPNQVNFRVALQRRTAGDLVWERFGGYRVPFTPAGNKLGYFEGEIYAENHFFKGATEFFATDEEGSVVQEPNDRLHVRFHVLPSLVVLDNRAFGDDFIADCREPSTEVLSTMRYALRVKALGFEPGRFEFVMSEGLLQTNDEERKWVLKEEPTRGSFAAAGNDEFAVTHRWSPPPKYANGYLGSITAKAIGLWTEKSIQFPFIVRPWTYLEFDREPELAETFPPQIVSGCIPGGPASLQVSYSETNSETRSRELATSVHDDIEQRIGQQHSETYEFSTTDTFSETESVNVTEGTMTSEGESTSVTELFSRTADKTRTDSLGWVREDGGLHIGTYSLLGIRNSRVLDFLKAELEGKIDVGLAVGDLIGFEYGLEHSRGLNKLNSIQLRDTWENEDSVLGTEEEMNSRTRGRNVEVGTNFNLSRTYEEQIGLSQTRSQAQQESFGQTLLFSQTAAESLGATEEERETQSSRTDITVQQNAWVWAGLQGTWYRQTARVVRRGGVVALDLCGNSTVIGEMVLSEWKWAVDLGIGQSCPPPTNHEPAQCRIAPCVQ